MRNLILLTLFGVLGGPMVSYGSWMGHAPESVTSCMVETGIVVWSRPVFSVASYWPGPDAAVRVVGRTAITVEDYPPSDGPATVTSAALQLGDCYGLCARDAQTGALKWVTPQAVSGNPPIMAVAEDRFVVVTTQECTRVLDLVSGRELWRATGAASAALGSDVSVGAGAVWSWGKGNRGLLRVALSTGVTARLLEEAGPSVSWPLVTGNLLVFERQDSQRGNELQAVDLATMKLQWSCRLSGRICAAPLTVANGLLTASTDDGWLFTIGAANGVRGWRRRARRPDSNCSLAAGRLLVALPSGRVQLLDASNGLVLNSFEGDSVSSCAASRGLTMFAVTRRSKAGVQSRWTCLYAVDEQGEVVWSYATPAAQALRALGPPKQLIYANARTVNGISGKVARPFVDGDVVYYSDGLSGWLYGIDLRSGEVVWQFSTMDAAVGSAGAPNLESSVGDDIVVANGLVYFHCRNLFCAVSAASRRSTAKALHH